MSSSIVSERSPAAATSDRTFSAHSDSSTKRPSPVILTLSVASSPAPANASKRPPVLPHQRLDLVPARQLLAQDVDRCGAPRAG